MSVDEVSDLLGAMHTLCKVFWRCRHDNVTGRTMLRFQNALAEVTHMAISSILLEMKENAADPQVLSSCLSLTRLLLKDQDPPNPALRAMLEQAGFAKVLVQVILEHMSTQGLMEEALGIIEELHGFPALLEALNHLASNPLGARLAMQAIRRSVRNKWEKVQHFPADFFVSTFLKVLQLHPADQLLQVEGLELLGDFAGEVVTFRSAFANTGGWMWLVKLLDNTANALALQQSGVRLISQLCKGGCCTEAHAQEASEALSKALQRNSMDGRLLYWGLWALQQLHGISALARMLQAAGSNKANDQIVIAVLKALGGVSWGQGDGSGPESVPLVLSAVMGTMDACKDSFEILWEGVAVLGHVASYACSQANLLEAGCRSLASLMNLLRLRGHNSTLVALTLEALAETLESAGNGHTIVVGVVRDGLMSPSNDNSGRSLLSQVTSNHVGCQAVQVAAMWLAGLLQGAHAIVEEMEAHPKSHAVQIAAIKSLGPLYAQILENFEPEDPNAVARPRAMNCIMAAMHFFPDNNSIQQNGCYALSTMAEHGTDKFVCNQLLVRCLSLALTALTQSVQATSRDPNYNAIYLQQEAARLISSVCSSAPILRQWLHEQNGKAVLGSTVEDTAQRVTDGSRNKDVEEALRHELLAMAYIVGASTAISGPLQYWGKSKPSVVRACADIVIELSRRNQLSAEELQANGLGAQLVSALEAHPADDDLHNCLQLAVGFARSQSNGTPIPS